MNDLPRIGESIILTDVSRYTYTSRVEGVEGDRLTVARPIGLPAASPYGTGAHFDLSWVAETGIYVLPVTLTGSRREGILALWDVVASGNTWVEQRREFVRVPLFGRVTVYPLTSENEERFGDVDLASVPGDPTIEPDDEPPADTGEVVRGVMVDLSEAALQCTLWSDADDERIAVGRRVACEFWIHNEKLVRRGAIIKQRPTDPSRPFGQCNVVIEFDQSASDADAVRHHVYAIQINMRRSSKLRAAAAERGEGAVRQPAPAPAVRARPRPRVARTAAPAAESAPVRVPEPEPAPVRVPEPEREPQPEPAPEPEPSPVERLFQVGKPRPGDDGPEFRADL